MADRSALQFNCDDVLKVSGVCLDRQVMTALFFDLAAETGVSFNIVQRSAEAAVPDTDAGLKFPDSFAKEFSPTVFGFYSETQEGFTSSPITIAL